MGWFGLLHPLTCGVPMEHQLVPQHGPAFGAPRKHDGAMESPDDASDADEVSQNSAASSEISKASRPGKFTGPASTWRTLTEEERLVYSSMTLQRDQDLSLHLYNAHAMKRRQYHEESAAKLKPWANKDRWRGNKIGEDNENSVNYVPPRPWTAWPLSSDVVPRSGEQIGAGDGADELTLKRRESQRPSRELEDTLIAIMLRISKDRFENRKWEHSQKQDEEVDENGLDMQSESDDVGKVERAEEPADEMAQDVPLNTQENTSEDVDRSQRSFDEADRDIITGGASQETEQRLEGGQEPVSETAYGDQHPSISADDERSRKILRPTIRHALSRLDELLMALHNGRQTCLYYASEHTESQSEFEGGSVAADASDANESSHQPSSAAPMKQPIEPATKRSRPGRPPKVLHIPPPSAVDTVESVEPCKTERRGRKRKLHLPLEGESREEMLVRIARQQKKAMPFTSAPTSHTSSSPTKSARGSPPRRGTSAATREKRSTRLGLRDWSEILGTAALLGYPPGVIDRATQRCASLFGEGMTMLALVENPISGDGDEIVEYLPGEIPEFDTQGYHNTTTVSESDETSRNKRWSSMKHSWNRLRSDNEIDTDRSEAETRTSSGIDTSYFCSYRGCSRYKRGFSKRPYLKEHLGEVHKLDKTELDAAQEESYGEMEGGVHVNGFMKQVKRRTGWRALDGKPRWRQKNGERVNIEEAEEDIPSKEEPSGKSSGKLGGSDSSLDEAFESD